MRAADAAIIIVALVIAWSFYKAHTSQNVSFNLYDLLMENGKVSRLAVAFLGAFGVCSWIMIRTTIDGKMTEGLFLAYGAVWVAPILARLFSNVASSSTTVTATTTKVTP